MFFGGILYRVILWELLRVFMLSLIGLTGLFVIAGVVQQAAQFGLSLNQILRIIPLIVPYSLPYTIPATTLFAACVVYGRIAHDNEAVVLKAAGVDLLALLSPTLTLGILATIATATLAYAYIPEKQRQLQEEMLRDPEEMLYNVLKRERRIREESIPWELYFESVRVSSGKPTKELQPDGTREATGEPVKERWLINVVAKLRTKGSTLNDPKYDQVGRTKEARLKVETRKDDSPGAATKVKVVVVFESKNWIFDGRNFLGEAELREPPEFELPDRFRKEKLIDHDFKSRSSVIDWPQLQVYADYWRNFGRERAEHSERLRTDPTYEGQHPPEERARQMQHAHDQSKFFERTGRTLLLEYYMRPALAFGCICFALIGCPVGLWANRADYLSTFVICFLPTAFSYYPLLLSGGGLARDGSVPMLVGVWGANFVALSVSFVLIYRLIKR